MIESLWREFPRLVVQNINGLLETAQPNALRSLQIYRKLRSEDLIKEDVLNFTYCLETYYDSPRSERSKGQFDKFLNRPMSGDVYALFDLDFRTAVIADKEVEHVASWAYNILRLAKQTTVAFMSLRVMTQTIQRLTSPHRQEKAKDLDFDDFCHAWKRTVHRLFGYEFDEELSGILKELHWLNEDIKRRDLESLQGRSASLAVVETALIPGVYLSKPEMTWVQAVQQAATTSSEMPHLPLEVAATEASVLRDLIRTVHLYSQSRVSSHPEVVRNRERIRLTVLDRCEQLLGKDEHFVG